MKSAVRTCSVCGKVARFENSFADVQLFRCEECRHCFTNALELKKTEDYGPEYYAQIHKNWFDNPDTDLFEKIRQIILNHNPNASVLDVGCGNGNFLRYMRRNSPDHSLTGIDVTKNDPDAGIEYIQEDFLKWNDPQLFDVIVSLAAIEHFEDVVNYTQKLFQFTKPNGLVIVMTVNEDGILYRVARLMRRIGLKGPFERLYSRHHLNHFNSHSLPLLLSLYQLRPINHLMHNSPIASVDVGGSTTAASAVLKVGVWGLFTLGKVAGSTTLQTVVAEKSAGPEA